MERIFNKSSQILIPLFTVLGFLLISMQRADLGLIFNMIAQPFWFYSTWKSYKEAGQYGLLLTTVIMTFILGYGLFNYWVL